MENGGPHRDGKNQSSVLLNLQQRQDREDAGTKAASIANSKPISLQFAPLSMIARTTRKKCVIGRRLPRSCAQTGMPWNGNMKPESRIDGSMKKKVSCIACICVRAKVENV